MRQNKRRAQVNGERRSALRTSIRNVEEAIEKGDQKTAKAALQIAEPKLARGAQKGVVNKNMVRRKLSRLTVKVKNLTT